ncbi:MAG: DUF4914 family protein, partial [Fimbriimonadaceae bacterium]
MIQKLDLPPEVREVLEQAPSVTVGDTTDALLELALKDTDETGYHRVGYEVPGKGYVEEATVCRTKNGISANYVEAYMRRRDPDCMVIGDEQPTNKPTYKDRYGESFESIRQDTLEWLKTQDLAIFCFMAGAGRRSVEAIAICPANAGFFAFGLALLQGILTTEEVRDGFQPKAVLFVAPPYRHTHFKGKQIVVHNRLEDRHELFSYNLYPGPSAKKGVYGMLINIGEREGWVTAHCSTVKCVTPYESEVVFMHEGASGGGKSEMLEHVHRQIDGSLLVGRNLVNGEEVSIAMPTTVVLKPVTDDMALCRMPEEGEGKKLRLRDAEDAWFLRVNHIAHYGTDPHLEKLTVEPKEPLLFLNIDAKPDSTALIWEHYEDEPGVPCPNPRVVVPRAIVPNIVNDYVTVDVRSFGVRTPPCTMEKPTYGIIGMMHVLPPALAWLWRLVAPRGHGNPSIVEKEGMQSEGVGSYWPFATGKRVYQANLLLNQFLNTPDTLFTLFPNQHVGAWKTGFMPQWLGREYLSRRGGSKFRPDQLVISRCPLLGRTLEGMQIEGTPIQKRFFQVETQAQVGESAYDAGAAQLRGFFYEQLKKFLP